MDQSQFNQVYLINPKVFHLEMPLYHEIDFSEPEDSKQIYSLFHFSGTIDAYCVSCEKESVFQTDEYFKNAFEGWPFWAEGFLRVSYRCTRNEDHKYYTYHYITSTKVQKIGQYPSVASFQIPQAQKYRKILKEERYKVFTKAIGLKAHGVGIGSFVYLRRIFESLITEALKIHKSNLKQEEFFAEADYFRLKMDERINFLKNYLPEFLVENRALYSILSKGIHELNEDECLEYFDAVKIGIEQILDEKILHEEKTEKARLARAGIQHITQKISK